MTRGDVVLQRKFSPACGGRIEATGHDVLSVLEAGKAEQAIDDVSVLTFATSLGRAVLTLNRKHFIRLHREQQAHAGILVCTFDPDFSGQAARIDAVIQSQSALANQLLRINRPQSS